MRNSHGLGRAIALGTIIGIVVLALIAGGVVALRSFGAVGQPSYSPAPDQETTEVEGTGRVEFGARAATLNDDRESTIRFSIPELPEDIWQVFEEHAEPMIITSPLEITADPSLTGTVTLTRTYPVPVPEDAGATFAYFDTDLSAWVPVESHLSEDRHTLTATVDHLSAWTDFVSGTSEAMKDMAGRWASTAGAAIQDGVNGLGDTRLNLVDSGFYIASKIAGTHAAQPTCTGEVPDWVDPDIVVMDDHVANPLRWCWGSDPEDADLLQIRIANNRGYPVIISSSMTPVEAVPDGADPSLVEAMFSAGDIFGQMSDSVASLAGFSGFPIIGGSSATLTFSRPDNFYEPIVVTADPAHAALSLAVIALKEILPLSTELLGDDEAIFLLYQCSSSTGQGLTDTKDSMEIAVECITGFVLKQWEDSIDIKNKVKKIADDTFQSPGNLAERVSYYIAAGSLGWSAHQYLRDVHLAESARQLSAYMKPGNWETSAARPTETLPADFIIPGNTKVLDVSPVDRNANVQPGWSQQGNTRTTGLRCTVSPVGLSPGIYRCGSNAEGLNACFVSEESSGSFICPVSPFSREYQKVQVPGGVDKQTWGESPYPWGLVLDDGRECVARQGGAWGSRADGAIGAYNCGGDSEEVGLNLPGEGHPNGVDMNGSKWTLKMGEMGIPGEVFQAPRKVGITTAYFVDWAD